MRSPPAYRERRRLDPVLLARARLDHLGLEAALLRPSAGTCESMISAQSCASVAPPRRTGSSRTASPRVVLAGEERVPPAAARSRSPRTSRSTGSSSSSGKVSRALPQELDVPDELVVAPEASPASAGARRRRRARAPCWSFQKLGLCELLLELVEAGLQPQAGSKGNQRTQSSWVPDLLELPRRAESVSRRLPRAVVIVVGGRSSVEPPLKPGLQTR